MKQKTLRLGFALFAAFALGLFVANTDMYQDASLERAKAEARGQADAIMAASNQQEQWNFRINQMHDACVAGQKAFDKLTQTQRGKDARPICEFE